MGQGELLRETLRWTKGADKEIEEASRRREQISKRFVVVLGAWSWGGDFRPGDELVVDPSRKVKSHDYVLCRDPAGELHFGQARHQYRGVRYWCPAQASRNHGKPEPLTLPVAGVVLEQLRKF